ncbi:MAG: hypothetical protein JWM90_2064 [Thermoleophilia bacterium]|nr:hypothetical protein [Thermoleophilia bacterium]
MPGMDATTLEPTAVRAPATMRRLLLVVAAAAAIIAAAWWMTGPSPKSVDTGLPDAPPPLALPTEVDKDAPVSRAAALLATGKLSAARTSFIDIVAETPNDVPAQIGLILSGWKGAGPKSVERDMSQLASEYPDDAQVALHLGLVRSLLGENRAAREAYRDAIEFGQAAATPTSLRMSSLADDLLHPGGFQGYPPLLIQPREAAPAARAGLAKLVLATRADDRLAAREAATALADTSDAMSRVAAAVAIYDKDDPESSASRLEALADNTTLDPAARDRARLQLALATLWGGADREKGCDQLDALAATTVDPGTSRLATPIGRELCSSDPAAMSKP